MPKKKTSRSSVVTERAVRPKDRVPVGGHRDKLTVQGLDKDYSHRWVEDESEAGQRIFDFINGGWEFAPIDNLRIGQNFVYESGDVGSIARKPSGGKYLYLMRIPLDMYEEDQRAKQKEILETEAQMTRTRESNSEEGQYGGGSIKSTLA